MRAGGSDYLCLKHHEARRIRGFAPVATLLASMHTTDARGKHILAVCKALDEVYD